MTTMHHVCDRCGVRIDEHRSLLKLVTGPLRRTHAPELDLCVGCAAALDEWLADGVRDQAASDKLVVYTS